MYLFKELLIKEWEATKQIDDSIEANKKEKAYFNMNKGGFECPNEC